jgi:WD40 repeat protein
MLPILLLVGISVAADGGARQPTEPAALADSLGDPLPPGALARMGSERFRHRAATSLAYSPDGKTLVTAGYDGVRLWDAATGTLRRRFDFEAKWLSDIKFTANGIVVAGVTSDKKDTPVTLWLCDAAAGTVRPRLLPVGWGGNGCLSADGRLFWSSIGNNLCAYETGAGRELLRVPFDERTGVHALAPDGKTVAVGGPGGTVRVHDARDGKVVQVLNTPRENVDGIVYSRDARYLAVSSHRDPFPANATVWELKGGRKVESLESLHGYVVGMAFAPDGRHLALGSQFRKLRLMDFRSGEEIRRFAPEAMYFAVAFSPDGKTLATLSHLGIIRSWDTSTGQVLPGSADPTTGVVTRLAFGSDGKELYGTACAYCATTYRRVVWDSTTGGEIRRYGRVDDSTVFPVLAPDEKLLASWTEGGRIDLYDAATETKLRSLEGSDKRIWQVLLSPDGRGLVSQSDNGTIRQWDVSAGRDVWHVRAPDNKRRAMSLSPDGRWLAVLVDRENYIALWDLSTGREKRRFDLPPGRRYQAVLLLDDHFLTLVNRPGAVQEIRRWDLETGRTGPGVTFRATEVNTADRTPDWGALSPDGRMIATARGGKVRILEAATGGQRREFGGLEADISSFAFAPDGRRLATASAGSPVYVWDVVGGRGEKGATPEEIARCWTDLADADAAVAFRAIGRLAAAPDAGVRLLRDRLKAVAPPTPEQVDRLIHGLDSDSFATRQRSAEELGKLGDTATDALRKARASASSAEARRQLDDLLERAAAGTPEMVRSLRAVEALEWMATPAAATLLGELARGLAVTRLTREAAIARERLRRRQVAPRP